MDLKKALYNAHRYTSPSPTALKWMVPLLTFPAAYYGHKGLTGLSQKTLRGLGLDRAANDLKKTNPLLFATALTALTTAISQGVYRPDDRDQRRMGDWKSFFYPETLKQKRPEFNVSDSFSGPRNTAPDFSKTAAFDPMLFSAASEAQATNPDDALAGKPFKIHTWMNPSVNARALKESIWDTPGFTPGQKNFLRDSVDGAVMVADNPELLSQNDLGMGAQRAIVNYADEVPGLLPIALRAGTRAAEGFFLGKGLATLFGGSPGTVKLMQNTGLAAGVLSTGSDVMKKIKSYF